MPQNMADIRHHVCNLLYRYAEALDDGDLDTLKIIFAHAKLYTGDDRENYYEGEEGVMKMFEDIVMYYDDNEKRVTYEEGTPRTAHVISNPIIEPIENEPDKVTARSRFTVFQQLSNFPLQPIITGSYKDIFERVDDTWRFAERSYRTALAGDVSVHIKGFERFDPHPKS